MIGIINYGMGNLASVKNALDYLKIDAKIIDQAKDFKEVDKLILPGVGAFGMAMDNIRNANFIEPLREEVIEKKKPFMGICLGMQLLLSKSYEHGEHEGLGFIEGEVLDFNEVIDDLPVPHIGWNDVSHKEDSVLLSDEIEDFNYYFVHTFYCKLKHREQVAGTSNYGIDFDSIIVHENIYGCQFHPEKSQKSGLSIFSAFNSL